MPGRFGLLLRLEFEPLPGQLATGLKELSGWSVTPEQSGANRLGRAFLDRLRALMVVEVSSCVARIYGVHLDVCVAQFGRQLRGHHVHRGFRGGIANELHRREFPVWIPEAGDRPEFAGNIDDTAGRGFANQRQHRLRNGERPDKVGLKSPADGVDVGATRRSVSAAIGDSGVVDEDVELAELLFYLGASGLNGISSRHVELDKARVDSLFLELSHSFFA